MLDITPKQAQVLDHKGLSLLIIAPAGCGKTETLALRVRGLLDQQAVRASQRILVATFTKRARDNMHDRLSHYLTPREMREAVTVCNFHGLFARIIQAHSNVIGLDPKRLTMPEHDWVGERCRALKLKGLTNDVKSDISSAKRRALNDEQVLAELQGSGNQYAFMIEEQRQAESRLTYDDLPRLAELILANDEVAALYRQHFGAIIVDEFQDLTPQQLRVVQRIGYKKTTYAGDLAQGIYAFAGAQPEYVKKELETECSETIEFAESFRSSPAVLTAVNSLNSLTGGQVLTAAAPDSWPSGGLAAYRQFNRAQEEAKYIKNLCSWILSEGQAPQQRIGISARLKRRRQLVDEVIAASGLPYCIWDDGVLDKSIAQKIRSMLRGLSLSEFHSADDPLAFLRQAVAFDNEQDPDERTALSSAVDWCLDLLQKDLNPDTIQKRIQIGDNDSLITRAGIHLLTGHAGKGQQFDWMVVVGLEEDYLPSYQAIQAGDNSAMMDEEARTLAVMLSRARHGVLVTSSSVIPGDFIPNKRQSRFLTNLLPAVISDRQQIHDWLTEADWKAIAER
ncbi:ATP-dependent DNA helicase PcrA [Actinomyces oris]|uniref:DNA 3'-5' helicase n=1 Tax=Actinomyces oris TaxID=544580 RepID=A0A1Q8W049_9ACTO|nr:ATP-dependent helicase [Actinomyces oris]OLO54247.1 ATP-dependent DNA helicase PcrA [Actinomyces oris]